MNQNYTDNTKEKCIELLIKYVLESESDEERDANNGSEALRFAILKRIFKLLNALIRDKNIKYNCKTSAEILGMVSYNRQIFHSQTRSYP